mmetsp:Transcript_23791/g.52166  ORF Transcript_23791/g.52166 Transcript_23791/m.52166 type:complete len:103 (-) Transcript_23791:303-611(-)
MYIGAPLSFMGRTSQCLSYKTSCTQAFLHTSAFKNLAICTAKQLCSSAFVDFMGFMGYIGLHAYDACLLAAMMLAMMLAAVAVTATAAPIATQLKIYSKILL